MYGNEGKAPAAKGRGALVLSAVLACSVMGLAWWLFAGGDDPAVAPVPETMAQAEATDHAPAAVADEAQGTAGEQASPPLPVQALVSPKKSPTASSETPTAPAKAPKTDDAMDDGARGPIIIKRAIVPTKEEVERLRKESRGPSAPKSEPAGREDPARGLARRQSP